jgi:hypothetical protein
MDDFERRVGLLLHDTVPEPEHDIAPATVARLGRRRRAVAIGAPVTAVLALAVAAVLVFALAPWRTADHARPAAPAPHQTLQLGPLTFSYPATWHTANIDGLGDGLVHSGLVQVGDDPVRILSSRPIVHVCSSSARGVVGACIQSVRLLGSGSVVVGINIFHPDDRTLIDPLLDTKVAGRPAEVIDRANVNVFCPRGTASSRDVTISLGRGDYLSLLGCLGTSASSLHAFEAFIDSAH